jgi:hypothetical protein
LIVQDEFLPFEKGKGSVSMRALRLHVRCPIVPVQGMVGTTDAQGGAAQRPWASALVTILGMAFSRR